MNKIIIKHLVAYSQTRITIIVDILVHANRTKSPSNNNCNYDDCLFLYVVYKQACS